MFGRILKLYVITAGQVFTETPSASVTLDPAPADSVAGGLNEFPSASLRLITVRYK